MTETGPDTSDGGYLTDASAGQHPRILLPGDGMTIDRQDDRLTLAAGGGGGSVPAEHRANVYGLTTEPGEFSFTDDAANKIPFGHVAEDSDGYWSVSDSAFIVPAGLAGLYQAIAQANWNSNHNALAGGDFRWLDMADKDHATSGGWWSPPDCKVRPVSDEHTLQQCYWVTPLAEGDSVAAWVRWGGFTDAVMEDITSVNTWFSLVKLA